jgi:hypothetical protein
MDCIEKLWMDGIDSAIWQQITTFLLFEYVTYTTTLGVGIINLFYGNAVHVTESFLNAMGTLQLCSVLSITEIAKSDAKKLYGL